MMQACPMMRVLNVTLAVTHARPVDSTFMSCRIKGKIQASYVAAVMRTIFTCQN